MTQKKTEIFNMIDKIKYAMFVTQADGLIGRPMETVNVDSNGKISFYTIYDSNKIDLVKTNPEVLLNYTDNLIYRYISVQGTAKISFDKKKIKKYWSFIDNTFYTEGVDTPNLCLVEVEVKQIECWNGTKNIFKSAWSLISGFKDGNKGSLGETTSISM